MSTSTSPIKRRRLIRVVAFWLLLPAALGVTELLVWAFKGVGEARRDAVATSYMPTKLRPNFEGTVVDLPFVTNRFGFRGEPDFELIPPPNEIRLMALGDSVGVGLGVRAEENYAKVAERQLNREVSDHTVHVVNAAGQGYSPSSYYAYLKHEGLKFLPKVVIVEIELCNDVTDEALLRWGPGMKTPETVRGGRYVVGWDGGLLGTAARGPYTFERTYTYTLLLRRLLDTGFAWMPRGPTHAEPGSTYFHLGYDRFLLTDQAIEAGWQRLFGSLEAIHQLCLEKDITFLLLILPSRFVFNGLAPRHQDFASDLLARAEEMALARQLPYLTFTEELADGGATELFIDSAHITAEGNQIIGEGLARELVKHLTP